MMMTERAKKKDSAILDSGNKKVSKEKNNNEDRKHPPAKRTTDGSTKHETPPCPAATTGATAAVRPVVTEGCNWRSKVANQVMPKWKPANEEVIVEVAKSREDDNTIPLRLMETIMGKRVSKKLKTEENRYWLPSTYCGKTNDVHDKIRDYFFQKPCNEAGFNIRIHDWEESQRKLRIRCNKNYAVKGKGRQGENTCPFAFNIFFENGRWYIPKFQAGNPWHTCKRFNTDPNPPDDLLERYEQLEIARYLYEQQLAQLLQKAQLQMYQPVVAPVVAAMPKNQQHTQPTLPTPAQLLQGKKRAKPFRSQLENSTQQKERIVRIMNKRKQPICLVGPSLLGRRGQRKAFETIKRLRQKGYEENDIQDLAKLAALETEGKLHVFSISNQGGDEYRNAHLCADFNATATCSLDQPSFRELLLMKLGGMKKFKQIIVDPYRAHHNRSWIRSNWEGLLKVNLFVLHYFLERNEGCIFFPFHVEVATLLGEDSETYQQLTEHFEISFLSGDDLAQNLLHRAMQKNATEMEKHFSFDRNQHERWKVKRSDIARVCKMLPVLKSMKGDDIEEIRMIQLKHKPRPSYVFDANGELVFQASEVDGDIEAKDDKVFDKGVMIRKVSATVLSFVHMLGSFDSFLSQNKLNYVPISVNIISTARALVGKKAISVKTIRIRKQNGGPIPSSMISLKMRMTRL
jgi:hypothetical protein